MPVSPELLSKLSNQGAPPPRIFSRSMNTMVFLAIAIMTLIAFSSALQFEFLNWDDQQLLMENTAYQGFTVDSLHWMFTTTLGGHFQPLTWLTYCLDHALWGINPFGFHLTNLALHAMSAALFYWLSILILTPSNHRENCHADGLMGREHSGTEVTWAAAASAVFFAVHPLRVESVAWVTERRDVLCGVFLILSTGLYLRSFLTPERRVVFQLASVGCYVLSLLSKASGITFPLVLLILDVFPLRRFHSGRGKLIHNVRWAALEKLAYLIPAAVFSSMALAAQRQAGALWLLEEHSLSLRLAQACYGTLFYIWKTILPFGLLPLYEQAPGATPLEPQNLLGAAFLIGASVAAWKLRHKWPAITAAWCSYLILLAPMLGLAQSGPQLVADRYSYFSCMPWAILLGSLLMSIVGQRAVKSRFPSAYTEPPQSLPRLGSQAQVTNVQKSVGTSSQAGRSATFERDQSFQLDGERPCFRIAFIATAALLLAMLSATRTQLQIWRNSETLWSTVLSNAPQSGVAHANLASVLFGRGDFDRARRHAEEALRILPGNLSAHALLASAALELNDLPAADRQFRQAIEIARHARRDDLPYQNGLAITLDRLGQEDEALRIYKELATRQPENAAWPLAIGTVLARSEQWSESGSWFARALQLDSRSTIAAFRLGVARKNLDDFRGAIAAWEHGLAHSPGDGDLVRQLVWTLAVSKDDSIRDASRARKLLNELPECQSKLGRAACLELDAVVAAAQREFPAAIRMMEQLIAEMGAAASGSDRAKWQTWLSGFQKGEAVRE